MARIALRQLGRGRVLNAALCAALLLGLVFVVASTEPADPIPQVQLSSGSAWLVSPSVAAVTLVDGPSEQVVASRRLDATPNDELTVTQAGTDAYAVDHTEGTVARIDGATLALGPARKFADTAGALRLVGGTAALYALDANRGLASRADPVTLQPQSEISLAARPRPDQIVVDHNGRLWLVDADRGGLIWVDGATKHESDEPPGPDAQLVLVRGRPVLADLAAGELHTLDDDGDVTSTTCLDVRDGAAAQLLGSATQETVYGAVSDTGTLLVAGTNTDDCESALPVSQPHDILGAPVASDRFVFIPNITKGTTVIVDTESRQVLSPELNLVDSGHHLELIAKDGLVFYNDLDGDKAGVLTYEGTTWRVGKSLSKFDPNTGKPADLDVPALPPTGPAAPGNNADAAPPFPDSSGDQAPASNSPQQTDQPRQSDSPSQPDNPSGPSNPSQFNNLPRPNNPARPSNPLQPTNPGQTGGQAIGATFRLQLTVNGDGRVTGPGGIDCPGSCTTTVTDQTAVTLIAQPTQSGATIQWTEACAGQLGACSFTATADTSISVAITPPLAAPILSVAIDGPGTVLITTPAGEVICPDTCNPVVSVGQALTLVASPTGTASFTNWSGACAGQGASCRFTVSADAAVTASFDVPTAAVDVVWVNGAGGDVQVIHGTDVLPCPYPGCHYDFPRDDIVTLRPIAQDDWIFVGWAGVSGTCLRDDCTFAAGHDADSPTGDARAGANFMRISLSTTTVDLRNPTSASFEISGEGATLGFVTWSATSRAAGVSVEPGGSLSGGTASVMITVTDASQVSEGPFLDAIAVNIVDSNDGFVYTAFTLSVVTNAPPIVANPSCARRVADWLITVDVLDPDPAGMTVTGDVGAGPQPMSHSSGNTWELSLPLAPQPGLLSASFEAKDQYQARGSTSGSVFCV